ncbi:replication initiation protein [Pseudoxanthomonas winnipegensis]|nr:replication initiation protein [Pseudoxanthomonas winnipegensis]WJI17478.1 replication initiation protein [Pseudoxanthomonas winnipegensis]
MVLSDQHHVPTIDAIDAFNALNKAAARRAALGNRAVSNHGVSAAAGGRSLGLVPSTTSGHGPLRLAFEIDANRIRSLRLKKSIVTGARLHDEEAKKGSTRGAWYMLTTTYRRGCGSSPRDISDLLKRLRRFVCAAIRSRYRGDRPVFRYLWVGELTKALVPHYHVLIWIPRGVFIPKADAMGWWAHGMTKIERARNAVGYLAKYASKFTAEVSGAFPKGFRTHGVGGLNQESKRELRWWKAPLAARQELGPLADIRKALGGYVDRLTGAFWASPWHVFYDLAQHKTIAWRYA